MPDETNIGGVNISDISGGIIQTGDISTNVTAGGDVVGRDKIVFSDQSIHIHQPVALPVTEIEDRRGLSVLLERMHQFWVQGVLEKSVHHAVLLDLHKESQPAAVDHPWSQLLELPDQETRLISPDEKIIDIFEEAGKGLLILGMPGAGKTITLLKLAQELINRAELDPTFSQPVPVVFNLSSWAAEQPLVDWLVEELATKYQVSRRIGRQWLENNRLLLLLDGLDEVREDDRTACIKAINDFGEEIGLAGLVVCSRLEEYSRLPVQLRLNGAIRLLPLNPAQIDDYLARVGQPLAGLRTVLQSDSSWLELAGSPLMLSVMSLVYRDVRVEQLADPALDTARKRRRYLFDTYIEQMFKRIGRTRRELYSKEQTISWLSWLARKMLVHSQSVFVIERMQPGWLPEGRANILYVAGYLLLVSLLGGLLIGTGFSLTYALMFLTAAAFTVGSISQTFQALLSSVGSGIAIIFWFVLLTMVIVSLMRKGNWRRINTVESLGWSWHTARQRLSKTTPMILSVSLLFICFGYALNQRIGVPLFGSGTLLIGLVVLVGSGLHWKEIEQNVRPNQGIWQSAKYAVLTGLGAGIAIGASIALPFGIFFYLDGIYTYNNSQIALLTGLIVSLIFGGTIGTISGVWAGIFYGGLAVIQHVVLRLILTVTGEAPSNLGRFLDYSVERVFLRKVGGSYIFIHRMLLEHFAMQTEQGKDARAYFQQGLAQYNAGNLAQASLDLSLAIELNPELAPAYYYRGAVYHSPNDTGQSVADYSTAIELDPDFAPAYFYRGVAYAASARPRQAIQDLRQYLALNRDGDDREQVMKMVSRLDQRRGDEQIVTIKQADTTAENVATDNAGAAQTQTGKRRMVRVIKSSGHLRILGLDNNLIVTNIWGDWRIILRWWELLLIGMVVFLGIAFITMNSVTNTTTYLVWRGDVATEFDQPRQAIDYYSQAIPKLTSDLSNLPPVIDNDEIRDHQDYMRRRLADTYYKRGLAYLDAREITNAYDDFSMAIELSPDDIDFLLFFCFSGSYIDQAQEVLSACEQVVQSRPSYGLGRYGRGLARSLTGDYQGAINDLDYYAKWTQEHEVYQCHSCEAWIIELKEGRNPFDRTSLRKIIEGNGQ